MSNEKIDLQIHESKDYSRFIFDNRNRTLNGSLVTDLMKTIKKHNFLHCLPIVVKPIDNDQFLILEGQHRYQAARGLRVPIYYIISYTMDIEHVSIINHHRRDWKIDDYLKYFVARGNQEYILAKEFSEHYEIPILFATSLLDDNIESSRKITAFRDGLFKIKDLDKANIYVKQILDLAEYIDFWRHNYFLRACHRIIKHSDYNHDRMMEQIKLQASRLNKAPDTLSYVKQLELAYNYNKSKKNYVFFVERYELCR